MNAEFVTLADGQTGGRRLIDLSHRLETGTTVYPGDPCVQLASAATIEANGFAVMSIEMGTHSGTHVDAPSHLIPGGATMDEIALERLVGTAHLIRVPGLTPRQRIGAEQVGEAIEALPDGARIVLIATGWDRYWGDPAYLDHPYLSAEVAERLRDRGVDVLGTDTLNPDPSWGSEGVGDGEGVGDSEAGELPVHQVMLGSGRLIIENLRGLMEMPEGVDAFEFAALPLSLSGADGAPVRAVGVVAEGCLARFSSRPRRGEFAEC